MPRYYFNIIDGTTSSDSMGSELANFDEAQSASIRLASELLRGEADGTSLGREWRLEVTDDNGSMFQINISMSKQTNNP